MSENMWTPKRVKALRKRLGLFQIDFGGLVGRQFPGGKAVSQKTVSFWECGTTRPCGVYAAALDQVEARAKEAQTTTANALARIVAGVELKRIDWNKVRKIELRPDAVDT